MRRFRERLDEFTGIAKAAQHKAIRELNWVVEALFPTRFRPRVLFGLKAARAGWSAFTTRER